MEYFITAVHRDRYEVMMKDENNYKSCYARLKTGVYYSDKYEEEFPTVGDHVEMEYNPVGDSLITKTLPRKSKFSRKDPDVGRGEQTIAANFDYIFIMMSLNFDFNLKRLERYLTVAWQSQGQPVVVLTKADLAENMEEKIELARQAALGADVYAVSAVTGEGMEELQSYLQPNKSIVFLGSSGVGKSTFTNFLLGDEVMETSGIREEDSKGHHTTTHRQMFLMKNGARIIDTPGMRELGMWVVDDGLDQSFSDILLLLTKCRYNSCTHQDETGCAIREAISDGSLTEKRWINYCKIQKESAYQAKKEKFNLMRGSKKTSKRPERSIDKVHLRQQEW